MRRDEVLDRLKQVEALDLRAEIAAMREVAFMALAAAALESKQDAIADAVRDREDPTRVALRQSAFDLIRRMVDLPAPPSRRRLNRVQAAAYCGISPSLFDEEVRAGRYPRPISKGAKGGRKVWDVKTLDRALDVEIGLGPRAGEDSYLARLREH